MFHSQIYGDGSLYNVRPAMSFSVSSLGMILSGSFYSRDHELCTSTCVVLISFALLFVTFIGCDSVKMFEF